MVLDANVLLVSLTETLRITLCKQYSGERCNTWPYTVASRQPRYPLKKVQQNMWRN